LSGPRTLSWDWYPGTIPANVDVDDTAYIETSFSFLLYRSQQPGGVTYRKAASTYLGTMFDVGPVGCVVLGNYALVHGARIICDQRVEIGDYALISWNVVLMDTYRAPCDRDRRRQALREAALGPYRYISADEPPRPVLIGSNVWIGFDSCIVSGVTVGEGAIVGARSVVASDVAPFTIVAGNPAREIRRLTKKEPA